MKHDWVTKIQCSMCLGVQTPENKDDDSCSGGVKGNFSFGAHERWEKVRGITRRDDGAIPKEGLVHGRYYLGRCRNAQIARWDGVKQCFTHWRHKFYDIFLEDIKCREDELHFDVFDPFYELAHDSGLTPIPVTEVGKNPCGDDSAS
jgi:hypothetical protein